MSIDKSKNCMLRMKGIYNSVKSSEKQLIDYIFANAEVIPSSSIEQLASASQTSYATVSRFCKKLGFYGYKEFKQQLALDLRESIKYSPMDYIRNNDSLNITDIYSAVFAKSINSIEESLAMLVPSDIEQVVNKILSAETILIIGAGHSAISAKYGCEKILRLGKPCYSESDPVMCRAYLALLKEGDVLLAISSSGRTKYIVEVARLAREKGIFVVGLSDFAISPLTKTANINVYTTPRNTIEIDQNVDSPLISVQIIVLSAIYACCCNKDNNSVQKTSTEMKKSIDEIKL